MTSATPYDGAEDTPTSASEGNRRRSAELFAVLNGDVTAHRERHAAREELVHLHHAPVALQRGPHLVEAGLPRLGEADVGRKLRAGARHATSVEHGPVSPQIDPHAPGRRVATARCTTIVHVQDVSATEAARQLVGWLQEQKLI